MSTDDAFPDPPATDATIVAASPADTPPPDPLTLATVAHLQQSPQQISRAATQIQHAFGAAVLQRCNNRVKPLLVEADFRFDLLFLGCYGFDVNAGLTTPNLAEAETNRALIRVARRVVVLADHTKWGLVGLSSFARLSEVDVLITDDMLPADARNQVEEQTGQVLYADGMMASQVSRQSA